MSKLTDELAQHESWITQTNEFAALVAVVLDHEARMLDLESRVAALEGVAPVQLGPLESRVRALEERPTVRDVLAAPAVVAPVDDAKPK